MAGLKSCFNFCWTRIWRTFFIFLFRKFGRAVFVNKIMFFFVSMDSIDVFFYKRTSVFGRFDRRLLLCLCFISVIVRVAI